MVEDEEEKVVRVHDWAVEDDLWAEDDDDSDWDDDDEKGSLVTKIVLLCLMVKLSV